jgi:hypothetical protein
MRYFNDIVLIWKYTDKLTLTTEAAWARDDFGVPGTTATDRKPVNAFGLAQYVAYALSDTITLNARGELFRDDNGFFVAGFPANSDPVNIQKGLLNTAFAVPGGGAGASYAALTLGVTFKPVVPPPITSIAIRPEIRYDQSLGGKVFNGTGFGTFKDTWALTFGTDVIVTF